MPRKKKGGRGKREKGPSILRGETRCHFRNWVRRRLSSLRPRGEARYTRGEEVCTSYREKKILMHETKEKGMRRHCWTQASSHKRKTGWQKKKKKRHRDRLYLEEKKETGPVDSGKNKGFAPRPSGGSIPGKTSTERRERPTGSPHYPP